MRYEIRHRTTFEYEQTVSIAHHYLHLQPRDTHAQRLTSFRLDFDPEPARLTTRKDYFGNRVHYVTVQEQHRRFIVESRSQVDVTAAAPTDLSASTPWESLTGDRSAAGFGTEEFAFASPLVDVDPAIAAYAFESFTPHRPVLDAAMDLTSRIYRDFEYKGGVSDVSTPVTQVLKMRKGVCQDFAHFQIACLRSIGLAARYVSGYLLTHPAPGAEKLVGADASHAWLSLWAGNDWVDFDPTNNLIPSIEHITVAWGRDYADVSPTTGFIIGGGGHEVIVAVDVLPLETAGA